MNRKRSGPVKPRNREKKKRGAGLSQMKECRHMWMEGVCVKCGIEYSEFQALEEKNNGGQYETP